MKSEVVNKILKETETGYDLVAGKFSDTRKNFWTELEFIQDYAKDGDCVLDFGCGNGRLLEIFSQKKIDYLGLDISQNLIDVARRKYPDHSSDFQKISGYGSLALEDEFFNAVYSVAVFHHIPGKKQRRELAEEIFRVTKKGGYVVITVWNLWQDKYRENIFKNWAKKVVGRSDLGWNDCRISFTDNKGNVFKRYHHAWTVKEMVKIFGAAGFSIEKCEVVGGNILLIGKRPE